MTIKLDDLVRASRPRRSVCSVAKVLALLDAKDREVLDAAMTNDAITHSAIAIVLTAEGHDIQQGTISRHRRGVCTCGA